MTDQASLVVAIDGPGGVGKSTVSRRVATELGAAHLDTGAFYRAATVAVLDDGVSPDDPTAVTSVVERVSIDQRDGRTFLGSRDVTDAIRSDAVTDAVSAVSSYPEVRTILVEAQRNWVQRNGRRAVVEGRDIGTVVFPNAASKVYLDADPAVRAARRSGETGADREVVAEALARRDRTDSTRGTSPLAAAPDALIIDTTEMSIIEVVDAVLSSVARTSF